jgi:hypothetical protein
MNEQRTPLPNQTQRHLMILMVVLAIGVTAPVGNAAGLF